MAEQVILQQLPERNFCEDMFDGVCVLRGAIEQFFNNKEFVRTTLADMLPCDDEIRVVNAVTSIPEDYSVPSIAFSRSDINYDNPVPHALALQNASVVHPTMTLTFEIKTNNYRTTEYMAQELAQFLVTFTQYFRQFNLYLGNVVCGATQLFREKTPNYFFSRVTVNAGVPLTKWKYSSGDSILRSISYSLNIRNGDMDPVTII